MTDDQYSKAAPPPGPWTILAIIVMSVVTLLVSGYVIFTYSGSKTTTSANPPAQAGYAPIVDEVRPVPAPSTVGQGGGSSR